jgi:16S rRNA (cytosine967-C5)-methyltransferase
MLARAADWLKPGGTLVYSVCSLEPEEGERIAEAFLAARPDYALDPILAAEVPAQIAPVGGFVRVLPASFAEQGGADGFFIARFRRMAEK